MDATRVFRVDTVFEGAKIVALVATLKGNALFWVNVSVVTIELHSTFEICLLDFFRLHKGWSGGLCNIVAVTWSRQNNHRNT